MSLHHPLLEVASDLRWDPKMQILNLNDAPICRLPSELLVEIFIYCTYRKDISLNYIAIGNPDPFGDREHKENTGILPSLDSRMAPLKLCHICRYWRLIVISTPILWSRFSLHYPSLQNLSRTLAEAEVWLKLSNDCPLNFFITLFRIPLHETTG